MPSVPVMNTGLSSIHVRERKLGKERALGLAWASEGRVDIDPRQEPRERLNTLLHETIHCIFPDMKENDAIRVATLMSDALWYDKYRRVEI